MHQVIKDFFKKFSREDFKLFEKHAGKKLISETAVSEARKEYSSIFRKVYGISPDGSDFFSSAKEYFRTHENEMPEPKTEKEPVQDFSGQFLAGHNFSNCKLIGSQFNGADLSGALFNGADLTDANLQGANLNNANMFKAILISANMFNANLDGAKI